MMKKILFKNAFIIDGSGKPGENGSVLIEGDRIKAVEYGCSAMDADEIVDVEGLVVAPGFIDIHSHGDAMMFIDRASEIKLKQGVTSEVVGNCGFSPFPVSEDPEKRQLFSELMNSLDFHFPPDGLGWTDFTSYAAFVGEEGFGTNLLPLVAHGALRVTSMGSSQRKPTEAEMNKMVELLKESLEQGAWGFSTGLAYAPGSFAESEEIEKLCQEIKRQNSFYTSHIRNENDDVLISIDEVIEMGRKTGCKVNISHLKAMGVRNWHQTDVILKKIYDARAEGVDVSADQYPYPASSTILGILVPKWANDGGAVKMCERLESPELRESILVEIEKNMETRGGPERILITTSEVSYDPPIGGKSIAEIAGQFQLSPIETVAKLIVDNVNAVMAIYLSLADEDVEEILKDPTIMVGSDGMVNVEYPEFSHPRTFGTFPRVLGLYVREKKSLSLETAIMKMTSLPAERIGLADRGLLKPGYIADITIFDPKVIIDKGTYVKANQSPEGIIHVMINGNWAIRDEKMTGEKLGKILKRKI